MSGGTGFIGRHVVAELLASLPALSIRVLSRRSITEDPWGGRVGFTQGNVTLPATLPAAVEGVHAVIHCVQFPGHPIENPEKRWTFQEVDVRGTRNMLEACGRAGVRRFVYLSAAGSSVHPLYQAKCSAEEAIRRSELEWVVLRPDWVYGPGDRGLVRLATRLRWLPVVPVPGRDEIRARPVAVHDVARAAVLSISRREAAGRAFDIGGPEEFSLIEILRVVLRVMGKRRALVQVPFRAARLAAGLVSMIPGARISPSVLDLLLLREPGNPLIAEQALGFRCLDLETGLREYLGVVKK